MDNRAGVRLLADTFSRLIDVYSSYYGGMACVCWSPDGKYIVTGSQDDLVSIWSFEDRMLVARGLGHRSWVTSVAFDPWRCDENNYRFGSVAEDRRILLWDFSVGMLHRPRAVGRPMRNYDRDRLTIFTRPQSDKAYHRTLRLIWHTREQALRILQELERSGRRRATSPKTASVMTSSHAQTCQCFHLYM